MNVVLTKVVGLYPNGNLVQWRLDGATQSGRYAFGVERAGSPGGPWTRLATDADGYCYVDRFDEGGRTDEVYRRPNQLALHRAFYYRVRATAPDGARDEAVGAVGPDLDRIAARQWRKEVYDLAKMLRYNGRPAAVLKRRTWGARCPRCTDPVLRDATRSTCKACYGTGFDGGFWSPVRVAARRHAEQRVSEDGSGPRSDGTAAQLLLPHAPVVEKGDVVVFLDDNGRFRVEGFARPLVTAAHSRQIASVSEVERGHVLYTIRVDADGIGALV